MKQSQLLFVVLNAINFFCKKNIEAYTPLAGKLHKSRCGIATSLVDDRGSCGIGCLTQCPLIYFDPRKRVSSSLLQSKQGDDDDDDDDEGYIDDAELGDWRRFRMNLSESGISSSSSSGYIGDEESQMDNNDDDYDDDDSVPKSVTKRPKSVSKSNEKLLMKQNKNLAEEYLSDVWAHEAPTAEVGGLVLRLPLEAEIFRNQESSKLGIELKRILNLENNDDSDDEDDTTATIKTIPTRTSNDDDNNNEEQFSFSPLAAKTIFWYRKAKKILDKEMTNIAAYAENGEVDATKLPNSCQEFLGMYLENQQYWQEVCLVVECDSSGTMKTLVLNRPMAFSLSDNLAKLIINGAFGQVNDVARTELMVKLLMAYENATCGVYVGGPDNMDAPATIIHGIDGLEGAEEISPGSGIYRGGLKAAINGILAGEYSPLDFRFFIGEHCYEKGTLEADVIDGKYQPVACARSVALKQCIQLPKPLWHEVMELCGGELREISKLEMMKRNDLSFEELDE